MGEWERLHQKAPSRRPGAAVTPELPSTARGKGGVRGLMGYESMAARLGGREGAVEGEGRQGWNTKEAQKNTAEKRIVEREDSRKKRILPRR